MPQTWSPSGHSLFSAFVANNEVLFVLQALSLLLCFGGFVAALTRGRRGEKYKIYILISVVSFLAFAGIVIHQVTTLRLNNQDYYDFSCALYGVARDQFSRTIDIHPNGDATIQLSMTINAVRQDVNSLEQAYSIPHGTVHTNVKDAVGELTNGSKVYLSTEDSTRTTSVQRLSLQGPVLRGQQGALLRPFEWFSEGAFAMTRAELERRKQAIEYSAMKLTYPSNSVRIEVHFPEGYRPEKLDYDVWYGLGEVRNRVEYARLVALDRSPLAVRDDLKRQVATLQVQYPIVGLTYAITWLPAGSSARPAGGQR